jgi:hypothetical protein
MRMSCSHDFGPSVRRCCWASRIDGGQPTATDPSQNAQPVASSQGSKRNHVQPSRAPKGGSDQ